MVKLVAAMVEALAVGLLSASFVFAAVDTPDAKPSEPKPPSTKPPEATKPPDTKSDANKAPDAKASESTKPSEPKGAEPKSPAPAPTPKGEKPPEAAKPPGPPIVAIKLALMADPRLFPYDINVDMHGETAQLSGKVGSESEKTAAAEVAQSVEGVKSVTNNIEVSKDLLQILSRRKDDLITQYVKDRFGRSKTLESAHFDVKTEDGIVSLTGKTKFLVIALEAAEAARQVPGVKAVKSEGIRVEASE